MKNYEKFIRWSPKLFVIAAGLDLVKQCAWLLASWAKFSNQGFSSTGYEYSKTALMVDVIDRLISVFIFPLGWIGSAIVITLLIALYDRERTPHA